MPETLDPPFSGSFTYDDFNRLKTASYPEAGRAFSYGYDRYGNRASQTATQGSGPQPQLSIDPGTNRVSTNAYDAAGNVLSDGLHSYTYDADGNVLTVDGGQTAAYTYNALNQRVRYTYPGFDRDYAFNLEGRKISWWDGLASSPTLTTSFVYWNSAIVAQYAGNQVYFRHDDLLGTERLRTNYDGSTNAKLTDLPFGDNASGTSDQPRFAQLDRDPDSNYHAQFREYSPNQGRWMSPDPYSGSYDGSNPQSFDRYAYVLNNPLFYIDPLGDTTTDGNPPPAPPPDDPCRGEPRCTKGTGTQGPPPPLQPIEGGGISPTSGSGNGNSGQGSGAGGSSSSSPAPRKPRSKPAKPRSFCSGTFAYSGLETDTGIASAFHGVIVDHGSGGGLSGGQLTEASYGEGLFGGVGVIAPANGGKTVFIDYSGFRVSLGSLGAFQIGVLGTSDGSVGLFFERHAGSIANGTGASYGPCTP